MFGHLNCQMFKFHSERQRIIPIVLNRKLLGLFLSESYYLYLSCLLGSVRRTHQSQKNLTPVFSNNNINETIGTSHTGGFCYLCHYSFFNISDAKRKKLKVLSFTTCIVFQLSGFPVFNLPCSGKNESVVAVPEFHGH